MGTLGGGGGGGGCGESYAFEIDSVSSKWMKGLGVGLGLSTDAGGGANWGVWVGVLGDESWADSGEESVSNGGGCFTGTSWFFLGATDVTLESTPEPIPESRIRTSSEEYSPFLGDLMAVLVRDPFDFDDTFDDLSSLFSFFDVDLLKEEFLELGLPCSSRSSWSFDIREGVPFLCWETSVSGGLGGRPSLVVCWGVECSADFDLAFSSVPTSVDSGVIGLACFADNLTSSLLLTASLLCALLKDGYGRLVLDDAPGAEAVRASSGTRSAMDEDGSESLSLSLSFSLSFLRRWGDFTGSPVSGSMIFGRELLEDLCDRFGSFSFSLFDRCLLSVVFSPSTTSFSRSLWAMVGI
jgi:hypothetical protein